ncbi:hypothetical protein AB0L74_02455 [Streptomyces sp. NPDC052020]|uniref:hypothetical protein n=1 Tax=Streptomyces sp. NPDC052020 TaxID=3155677 RepID=UPI0034185EC3
MTGTPAVDRLATTLEGLRLKASLSLGQIEAFGKAQQPPVNLGKSKTSPWFTGKTVPAPGRPFRILVTLLEARAGVSTLGVGRWELMRKEAAGERRFPPVAASNTASSPTNSDTEVDVASESSPTTQVSSQTVPSPASPTETDRRKAGRLLDLLPPDGSWRTWLRKAPTLFTVPLAVSHPVCDAYEELDDDVLDYVNPALQEAHESAMEHLKAFYDELNGMHDVSDEGRPVLEMSYPGTTTERNNLNRQACQARDSFLRAYKNLVNLLNAQGLVPASGLGGEAVPQNTQGSGPDLGVELLAGCTLEDGRIIHIPIGLAGAENPQIFSEPYYLVVKAANRSTCEVQVDGVRMEIDYGVEVPALYTFAPAGPGGRAQLPFKLGSHASGHAHANAAELGNGFAAVARDRGRAAVPKRVRPVVWTGSGIDFFGSWTDLETLGPFLLKAMRGE